MGRKGTKISADTKLEYARLCFENKMSKTEADNILSVHISFVDELVHRYQEQSQVTYAGQSPGSA